MFSLIGFLLISKYLYFILNSSPPSVSSSMVKGGVFEAFNIFNSVTRTSISPVFINEFLDFLSITVPLILITNSRPSFFADSIKLEEVLS